MLNPISFRPGPVTFWTTLVYLALIIPLVVINESPRPAPAVTPFSPTNLTEAWLDLATISRAYHPYNSQNNDVVRAWLLRRIGKMLDQNGASWSTETLGPSAAGSDFDRPPSAVAANVVVFNDLASNLTSSSPVSLGTSAGHASRVGQASYFEGPNIYTYIRGSQDDPGDFWKTDSFRDARRNENGLTLVNAHYDSASTGFGATDDGIGVATVLQLIKYFSYPGHQPKRGIVLLFNNDEENGLQGARAFGQSPLAPFCHTFVNLEGAGAGGRCVLFRSTDAEVTAAYKKVPDPFGTVLFSDAFKRGFVRSDTDYSVFHNIYGQRGLDISFYKPRSSYHTNWDDASHASRASLWQMIATAVSTVGELSSDTGRTFVGPRPDGVRRKVANGSPTDGVWFDLFGRGFVLFGLRGMFAWSLAVLIAGPLILILVTYILHKLDKYYFFSSSVRTYEQPDYEIVAVGGMKGFFRFPLALVFAGALSVGVALLLHKVNPFVIYTYRYTVWATVLSLFYFVFWAIMRGSNFARPSALHRGYVNIWLFILGWAILVLVTALEDRLRIGAGYIFVFLETAMLVSAFLSLCELFALPKKTAWGQKVREDHAARDHGDGPHQDSILSHLQSVPHAEASASGPASLPTIPHHASLSAPSGDGACSSEPAGTKPAGAGDTKSAGARPAENTNAAEPAPSDDGSAPDADDSHERAPLLGGDATSDVRTTFATTYRRSITALVQGAKKASEDGDGPYEHEQAWSGNLPSWIWFFQFMLLGPFTIILATQTGLVIVDSTHQTGADGSSLLTPYLAVVLFTILLLLPLTPFIHRVTHHIPVFLLVVFVATLAFNLVAFPFSDTSRYKVFFLQTVDLDTGSTAVHFAGLDPYVQRVIADMPSASGREITCGPARRSELIDCSYDGSAVMPNLGGGDPVYGNASSSSSSSSPATRRATTNLTDLVTVNITRSPGNSARLEIDVVNSRTCFLQFNKPLLAFSVVGGSGWDDRFGPYPEGGCDFIKMSRWNRDKKWVVDIEWGHGSSPFQAADDGDRDGGDQAPLPSNTDLKMTRKRSGLQHSSTLEGTAIGIWSDANTQGDIPGFDQALKFAPTWVAVTKMDAGLVEGRKRFSI